MLILILNCSKALMVFGFFAKGFIWLWMIMVHGRTSALCHVHSLSYYCLHLSVISVNTWSSFPCVFKPFTSSHSVSFHTVSFLLIAVSVVPFLLHLVIIILILINHSCTLPATTRMDPGDNKKSRSLHEDFLDRNPKIWGLIYINAQNGT